MVSAEKVLSAFQQFANESRAATNLWVRDKFEGERRMVAARDKLKNELGPIADLIDWEN